MRRAPAAYEDATCNAPPERTPVAAMHLGMLLHRVGDAAGARDAYERAIASGHPDASPGAALGPGNWTCR